MKYYEKWDFRTTETFSEIPKLGMQIVDVQCHHCGCITRIPVKPEFVDWERVAEKYRIGYDRLLQRFNQMIADIDVMQSGSNPIREYVLNEWKIILDEIRRNFEK